MNDNWLGAILAICLTICVIGVTTGIVMYNIDRNERRQEVCIEALKTDNEVICQSFMGWNR